jgi:hypothetical protein
MTIYPNYAAKDIVSSIIKGDKKLAFAYMSEVEEDYPNKDHDFVSKAGAADSTLPDAQSYLSNVGFYVLVFKNNQDAEFYNEEQIFYEDYMKEQLSVEKFGQKYVDDLTYRMNFPTTNKVYKNAVIFMNNKESQERCDEWVQKFEQYIDTNNYNLTEELSEDEFTTIKMK